MEPLADTVEDMLVSMGSVSSSGIPVRTRSGRLKVTSSSSEESIGMVSSSNNPEGMNPGGRKDISSSSEFMFWQSSLSSSSRVGIWTGFNLTVKVCSDSSMMKEGDWGKSCVGDRSDFTAFSVSSIIKYFGTVIDSFTWRYSLRRAVDFSPAV